MDSLPLGIEFWKVAPRKRPEVSSAIVVILANSVTL
jgi:hypothetical protein